VADRIDRHGLLPQDGEDRAGGERVRGEIAFSLLGLAGPRPLHEWRLLRRGGHVSGLAGDEHRRFLAQGGAVDLETLRRAAAVEDEDVHACSVVALAVT